MRFDELGGSEEDGPEEWYEEDEVVPAVGDVNDRESTAAAPASGVAVEPLLAKSFRFVGLPVRAIDLD